MTKDFFSILGVRPEIGRGFTPAEEIPGSAKVFLASNALWRGLLNSDPAAIGKAFRLNGEPYTLIGVLPPDFRFPDGCDLWTPVGALSKGVLRDRVSHQFWMLGRLRPNVTLSRAQAEMDGIQRRLGQAYPATDANWDVNVRPLMDEFVGNVRVSMWVLFGAVGFVLLIACTNVINLLLARGAAREKEFAVRAALGAVRARLLRQALTETLVLAAGGAALALVLAKAGLVALIAISGGSIPRFEQPQLSGAALAFSAGAALLAAFVVGIAPGVHAAGLAFPESLREGQRGGFVSRRGGAFRNFLVVSEVALTLLLLSGAGLMLRSFARLREVDPGFKPDGLVSMKISLPDALYPRTEQRAAFLHQLLQRLNATPGIEMAASADRLPLSDETNWGRINIAGRPLLDTAHAPTVEGRAVSANYFRTLGIPLLRGREFSDDDVAAGRHVTVINEQMANQFWPGGDPIGQRIVSPYRPGDSDEIIGVVGDVKDFALDAASPAEMYSPYRWWNTMNLVLRGSAGAGNLVSAVRAQAAVLDKEAPVYGVMALNDLVNRSTSRQRFELFLLAAFASIALALAAIGIYGLMAFRVNARTHEIGLRMALGAHPRAVLALIVSQAMKLVLAGVCLGLAGSLALMQLMSSLLYRVSPLDPLTLAAVTATLAAFAILASWIPARRAMSVDPVVALRCE